MTCPGSVALSAGIPDTSGDNEYATEGTRAHSLAELCFINQQEPDHYAHIEVNGVAVDEDMVEHVRTFVRFCRSLIKPNSKWWSEQRVSIEKLNPPVPMFGTCDFAAYDPDEYVLDIADLKYGMGVVVEVFKNPQLMEYALGFVLTVLLGVRIDKVRIHIIQPRVGHADGVIRTYEFSYMELVEFGAELIAAANATQQPGAKLVAGDHCRFCRAKPICPEQREHAQALAQYDFDVVQSVPPAPETLPLPVLAGMLPGIEVLKDWIGSVEQYIYGQLLRGVEVPGYKLVNKRALRQWVDTEKAEAHLQARYPDADIYEPRVLKSVAKIEKEIKKSKFTKDETLQSVVEKKSSGLKVVPESDPTPAVQLRLVAGEDDFEALLPAPEEE